MRVVRKAHHYLAELLTKNRLHAVAGGGSQNPTLMLELRMRCRGLRVRPSDELNLPSQSREALVFALLAWWHACRHPGNAPAVTGADRACVLGLRADPP